MSCSILEFGILEACESNEHNGRQFTTAGFQSAMARITNATPMMTPQLATAILLSVPGVERHSTPCTWVYKAK